MSWLQISNKFRPTTVKSLFEKTVVSWALTHLELMEEKSILTNELNCLIILSNLMLMNLVDQEYSVKERKLDSEAVSK